MSLGISIEKLPVTLPLIIFCVLWQIFYNLYQVLKTYHQKISGIKFSNNCQVYDIEKYEREKYSLVQICRTSQTIQEE